MTEEDPPVQLGVCGEEFWIADELWRLARTVPADYAGFVRVVVLLLLAKGFAPKPGRREGSR